MVECSQEKHSPTLDSSIVSLSDSAIKCNGQDISRKGGKNKSLMIVLPADLSFRKGTEGDFGYLEKMNSQHPELVIEVTGGKLRFVGKYVDTRAAFLAIDLQPTKKQSVCHDFNTRVLAFDAPSFDQENCAGSETKENEEVNVSADTTKESMSEESAWTKHFGCSAVAQPHSIKYTAAQRSRFSITTTSGVARSSQASDEVDAHETINSSNNHRRRKRTVMNSDKPKPPTRQVRKRSRVSYVESESEHSQDDSDDECAVVESDESSWSN